MPSGIYKQANGTFRVVASVGRGPENRYEKRFPKGTKPREMTKWQERARTDLRLQPKAAKGSLQADVTAYLAAVATMPTYTERKRHLGLWVQRLGPQRDRNSITGLELRGVLEEWRKGGLSDATGNRLRTAMMSFYSVLNGKAGYNPVRDVPRAREPQRPPKPFSYPLFEALIAAIPPWPGYGREPSATLKRQMLARLRVMAYVGLPQAQIKTLEPGHLLAADRLLYVRGRSKGAGTEDVYLPLSAAGLVAVEEFFACQAQGPFRNETLRDLFRAGAMAMGRPDLTPYDLRHLFGTTVLRLSKNRAATRDLMLHADEAMTVRYTRAAIPVELRAALDAFDAEVVAPGIGSETPASAETPVTH